MLTLIAAVSGGVAVALGAFGAHALSASLGATEKGWWETATFYLLVHAALVTALTVASPARFALAGGVMIAGAVVFAATLYAMALGAPRWFGAITPIGGLGMLAGWALITWTAFRN